MESTFPKFLPTFFRVCYEDAGERIVEEQLRDVSPLIASILLRFLYLGIIHLLCVIRAKQEYPSSKPEQRNRIMIYPTLLKEVQSTTQLWYIQDPFQIIWVCLQHASKLSCRKVESII